MSSDNISTAQVQPVSLVVVVLLWVATVPLAIWTGLCVYKLTTEPLDNPWILVLFVPAALAFLTLWSAALYKSVTTRR